MVVHIDARGAQRGVGAEIEAVMHRVAAQHFAAGLPIAISAASKAVTNRARNKGAQSGMSAISPPWPPSSTTLKWGLESNTGTFTSPLTKKTQMIARQGSRWHCTNELAYLNEDNARDWEGFFWLVQDGGYSFYWNR
jgi:hypothetical protein